MPATNTHAKWLNGVQHFYDGVTQETVHVLSPLQYYDDFLGAGSAVVPVAGSAESGVDWVAKLAKTAGTPTLACVPNAVGGHVAAAIDATSEKQEATLYWGDALGFDVTKGVEFESRVKLSVLPSATGVQAVWGMASTWVDGPNNNTCYLGFGATANGAVLLRSHDGVTTVSAATGVTLLNTTWAVFKIDATDVTDVKFYIDGAQVSTKGQVNFAATGTLAVLQPYLGVYKPSGTGVATLVTDYVKVWQNRV